MYHGINFNNDSALLTNAASFSEFFLWTKATMPSYSARICLGSRYVSMKPIYISTTGEVSFTQYI